MFKIIEEDGDARIGKLKTRHGTIETPFFMPVAKICNEVCNECSMKSKSNCVNLPYSKQVKNIICVSKNLYK